MLSKQMAETLEYGKLWRLRSAICHFNHPRGRSQQQQRGHGRQNKKRSIGVCNGLRQEVESLVSTQLKRRTCTPRYCAMLCVTLACKYRAETRNFPLRVPSTRTTTVRVESRCEMRAGANYESSSPPWESILRWQPAG